MEKMKVGILEPEDFSARAAEILREEFEVEFFVNGDIREFISDKTAIFVRLARKIDDAFVSSAPGLKYICSPTTGLNHIAVTGDIEIVCLKGEVDFLRNVRATPEHSFGLALALLRNYNSAFLHPDRGQWDRNIYRGDEIYGSSVGIIGFGRVGQLLAGYYKAFGAKVMWYDILEEPPYSEEHPDTIRCSCLEELLQSSDIIHMCASFTEPCRGYFSYREFELIRDKYFINTARGELLDTNALLEFASSGRYRGMALDVLEREEPIPESLRELLPYTESFNLVITPHISGATYASMAGTEEFIAAKLIKRIQRISSVSFDF